MDVRLPPLAEGADSGTVVNLLVKEGDSIRKDQTILELENQKAVAPIPAPAAGTVTKIHVKQGDLVGVGQILISLEPEGATGNRESTEAPRTPATLRQTPGERSAHPPSGFPPAASPTVRRMARALGIDLAHVRGLGRGGWITAADLKAHLESQIDFAQWGPITRKPFSPLRKAIAAAMVDSWRTIPHVTQFDEADPAVLLKWMEKYAPLYESRKARLTLTALLIRALVPCLKEHPIFNCSLDESSSELVFKEYIHIGIAVATEAGLVVPVLRDADKKSILEISRALTDLAERSRQRKLSAEDLRGGTFTLSNQGGIGGGHFTPIIHKPEVAILGVGRARQGRLPLALSYDHRVMDGADAARFVRDFVEALEMLPEKEVAL